MQEFHAPNIFRTEMVEIHLINRRYFATGQVRLQQIEIGPLRALRDNRLRCREEETACKAFQTVQNRANTIHHPKGQPYFEITYGTPTHPRKFSIAEPIGLQEA
jgi:hypothetical protein